MASRSHALPTHLAGEGGWALRRRTNLPPGSREEAAVQSEAAQSEMQGKGNCRFAHLCSPHPPALLSCLLRSHHRWNSSNLWLAQLSIAKIYNSAHPPQPLSPLKARRATLGFLAS